jgi:hypothetical protein
MQYVIFKTFRDVIDQKQFSCPQVKKYLTILCQLLGLWEIQKDCALLYDSGYFSYGFEEFINDAVKHIMTELRP